MPTSPPFPLRRTSPRNERLDDADPLTALGGRSPKLGQRLRGNGPVAEEQPARPRHRDDVVGRLAHVSHLRFRFAGGRRFTTGGWGPLIGTQVRLTPSVWLSPWALPC